MDTIEKNNESFLKINFKKFLMFFAFILFIPVPFNGGLVGGVEPVVYALFPILAMLVAGVIYFSPTLILFFLGETILFLIIPYLLSCLIYKSLLKINGRVIWSHTILIIILLFGVFAVSYFADIFYVTA